MPEAVRSNREVRSRIRPLNVGFDLPTNHLSRWEDPAIDQTAARSHPEDGNVLKRHSCVNELTPVRLHQQKEETEGLSRISPAIVKHERDKSPVLKVAGKGSGGVGCRARGRFGSSNGNAPCPRAKS